MPQTRFEALSDDDLHGAVRRLTARSNVTLADLLAHLGEVETRGIHRTRACATLYTYCLYELRMSEDAAYRRSKAARLVHQHPDLHGTLARGELHLTGLLMLAPYLGGGRHAELLERARFRSKREIARLIAEIDPKPEVPPRIEPVAPAAPRAATFATYAASLAGPVRSLPIGDRPEDWVEFAGEPEAANCVEDGTTPEPDDRELAEAERALEDACHARREAQADRPLRYVVQFTAPQEYVDLLDEAFDLLGCRKKTASLPEVQLRALRELVERLRKRKTGARGVPRTIDASEGDAPARVGQDAIESAARDAEMSVVDASAGVAESPGVDAPARVGQDAPARDPEAHADDAPARDPEAHADDAPARVGQDATVQVRDDAPARVGHNAPDSPDGASRYIPVAISRAVWARDRSRCAYVDERGRRCLETCGLEVHHRQAHARRGPATLRNLELRCRAHNTVAAEQDFGRTYMDRMRGRASA